MSVPSLLAKARGATGGPVSRSGGANGTTSGVPNNNNSDEEAHPLVVAASAMRGGSSSGRNQAHHARRTHHGPSSSPSSSSSSYMNPMCWRALLIVSVLAVVHVARQQQNTVSTYLRMNEDLEHRFFAGADGGGAMMIDPQRCVEDLPLQGFGESGGKANEPSSVTAAAVAPPPPPPEACRCMDPLLPVPKKFPKWLDRHKQLTEMASHAAMDGVDVVLLGDSIVEHFSGTRDMGQQRPMPDDEANRKQGQQTDDGDVLPELRIQSQEFATFAANTNLVALGCSGDTTNQLLFHLQYGVLPPQLRPKVFVVAIGTNNLGNTGCNARTTLAGILQVAQYLHQQRPEATIVLHGLFPRSDARHQEGPLHRYWGQIVWINQQLKKFCALHEEWRYFDVNKKLLERRSDAPYKVGLKSGLLPDGLHPSVEGYRIWSAELSKFIAKLLSDDDEGESDEGESSSSDNGATEQGKKEKAQKGKKGHDRRALSVTLQ